MASRKTRKQIETLAELRARRGLTQEAVAPHLGVQQPALSKLERKTNPSFAMLRSYVAALGGELRVTARFPGDSTEYEFRDVVINGEVPADTFELELPAGVVVREVSLDRSGG